ncbi:MAG: ABC transporter substrate-binding protein [Actinobacteria bacterium]|nr:ABC transporter substrate-binding protein [Actinomycetota bacterium]MSW62580.1 ABC transporter substrate-binding protein [Actinomycetota bacterium]MSX89949.1 ABC transporter substrate-binding protein [Actinomycetota bacterium]MSZ64143.1 ABC transporter substrate-binding protein [Actinomycetota bacterium]
MWSKPALLLGLLSHYSIRLPVPGHTEQERHNMKKSFNVAAAIAAAGALILGVTAATTASAAVKEVTIAYQGPLTGDAAQTGIDELNAVKYAIKKYNATNPAVKVNLVAIDDQGAGAVALTVAPGAAANKKIIAIVGPAFSGATIASLPYYKAGRLPMISPSATNVTLTNPKSVNYGYPVFHRVPSTDAFQGPALAVWAVQNQKSPKVYIVDDKSPYGTGLAAFTKKGLAAGTWAGSDSTPDDTKDFSATIIKIKASGTNVVIYTGYYSQAAILIKQLRTAGYTGDYAAGDGVLSQSFIDNAGKDAEGALMVAPTIPLAVGNPEMEADYVKLMGEASGEYSGETITITNVFLEGIKAGKLTRSAMLNWINGYHGTTFAGTKLSFDRNGDNNGAAAIGGFIVKSGKNVAVKAVKW